MKFFYLHDKLAFFKKRPLFYCFLLLNFGLFYIKYDGKTLIITSKDNNNIIKNLFKDVNINYYAPLLFPTCFAQMILNEKFKAFKDLTMVNYDRNYFKTLDGGIISLDIIHHNNIQSSLESNLLKFKDKLYYVINKNLNNINVDNSRGKVILILHGLTGGSNSSYIKDIVHELSAQIKSKNTKEDNTVIICMNYRGVNNTPLINGNSYHMTSTNDLDEVLHFISKIKYPNKKLHIIGTSMGANLATFYASKYHEKIKEFNVKSLVCISSPFNIFQLEKENCYKYSILEWFLLNKWKNYVNNHYDVLKSDGRIDIDKILSSSVKTYRDFDKEFTCKLFNFKSPTSYYEHCSTNKVIKDINIPGLFINSIDDILSPIYSVDLSQCNYYTYKYYVII